MTQPGQTTPLPLPTSPRPGEVGSGSEPLDLTGQTLAHFRVLRHLGQGGMGQVYLAEQISLKRKVALKIMRPELAANETALKRFKQEAEAVAQATHANIVQVYAAGDAQGIAYMALEYVEGRNLRDYLARKGPPDLLIALSIMRQVARALQRAGELGIVHRDIKPENILLTRKSEVKVADFGLSRCLDGVSPPLNLTQSGLTMGTPLYMAPEQVEGKPVDPRTDIYSFGITCYHMLAGHPPFRGATPFEVALQHVRSEPPPLSEVRPDLPESLCAVVHKMMAKDPAQRHQTARDLLREVVRVREGLSGATQLLVGLPGAPLPAGTTTVAVEPVGLVTAELLSGSQPVPTRRPFPGWVALLALLVVLPVAAGGGAVVAWYRRQHEPVAPPPDGGAVHAVDPGVEALQPSKREQALREAAEQYLNSDTAKNPANGFGLCLDLGLLYLEEDRLDDAEKLFSRLDRIRSFPPYRILGHTGLGIVLALRNQPAESSKAFREVFAPRTGLFFETMPKGGLKKLDKPAALDRSILQPTVRQMLESPQWRYWVNKAHWYNTRNGVADKDVPPFMKNYLLAQAREPAAPPPAPRK